MNKFLPFVSFIILFISSASQAQFRKNDATYLKDSIANSFKELNQTPGNYLKKPMEVLEGLEISGFYRLETDFRKLKEAYPHLENNKTNLFVGDDSQLPQLMLNINGRASNNTQFGTDLFMWTPLTGAGQEENVKGLNLGVNLYGNFSNSLGNFVVKAGGINWYSLSPFTFQTAKGNNRYSLFDRNPWDPSTINIETRYANFYSIGEINQDQRWGNQAFQGLIVEGNQLPNGFSFNGMYGKTQFDGGLSPIPNSSFGGRIMKTFLKTRSSIALNSFNNQSFIDSINLKTAGFNISTLEFTHYVDKLKIYGEVGLGRRFTNVSNKDWGEALSLKFSYPIDNKYLTELHLYRVSPDVFNNSSIFINSSIQENTLQVNSQTQPVLIPVSSAILPMGQLSNNRQGIEINSQINFGKFKNSIGYANSMELENLSSKLTYSHPFNNLALSRFWRFAFPSNVGPYNNLSKIYRSVFETVNITEVDSETGKPKKKYFNTVELSSKYKTSIFKKDLFIFYFGSINSVQNFASSTVNFSERALLRTYDHQFETYLRLSSRFVWCNYFGFERIIANYSTETDVETRRPKNQRGTSYATGFDIALSKGVGFYVRQRWMQYKDTSFTNDRYKGYETTVELKCFF